MGQVIAVTSGKGGTGKTTLCAGIASCLAADGKRVLCIDADIGLRNLDISLGMADLAPISFADVIFGRCSLSEAAPHPDIPGLFLLTAPISEKPGRITPGGFSGLLQQVRQAFDFCLIDAPAGLGEGFWLAANEADSVLVVSTPDPASMRDAACAADTLFLAGKHDVRLIVNRITPKLFRQMSLTVDDVMDNVGLPLLGIVPEDQNVVLSAAHNTALVLFSNQNAAVACLHIARRLCGRKVRLLKIR
ncbi:MAG: AAA family ATPase [Faecousia sp.]